MCGRRVEGDVQRYLFERKNKL